VSDLKWVECIRADMKHGAMDVQFQTFPQVGWRELSASRFGQHYPSLYVWAVTADRRHLTDWPQLRFSNSWQTLNWHCFRRAGWRWSRTAESGAGCSWAHAGSRFCTVDPGSEATEAWSWKLTSTYWRN
jgi:hypothetical protein